MAQTQESPKITWTLVWIAVGVAAGVALLLASFGLLSPGEGSRAPVDCDALDWHRCEAAAECEPVREESDEPGHPGFSCLDRVR